MAYDQMAVVRVPGSQEEQFVLVLRDSRLPPRNFMETSSPMNESDLRAHLQQRGGAPQEIAAFLQRAREQAHV